MDRFVWRITIKNRYGNLVVAKINKFEIRRFKGIDHVEIDVSAKVDCPVITLIGLNESGKTTILEAISHFVSGDRTVSGLFDGPHAKATGVGLIPVHRKAAFSAKVEVIGYVDLDEIDFEEIGKLGKANGYEIDTSALEKEFKVTRSFQFEDSVLKKTMNWWNIDLKVREKKKAKFKTYKRPEESENDFWLKVVNKIEEGLPQISYFPTFLVDMPAKIYLQEHDNEKPVNRHYRFVFQDILDSLGEGLTLEKHVCARISEFKNADKSQNWLSAFYSSTTRSPVDSVFQKISNAITKEVLGSWQRIFQRSISAKTILIEWNIDAERGGIPYATFYVSDGESRYAISERSLGFRWFFSFLLFTAFKKTKRRKSIFVFDEPAANLHAKAQAELLTSFARIASGGNKVIYSTHSHHMINPHWLTGAYIVENSALDYEVDDGFGVNSKPTKVCATNYRNFVANYPGRSSYFQPVIEKLEYVVPHLIGSSPFLVVEGISDFYALKLAMKIQGAKSKFSVMPGCGAGASGPVISQMLGRGERFSVLLDDDKAGKKAAERYRAEWLIGQECVIQLGDVEPSFAGMQLEGLLTNDIYDLVAQRMGVSGKPSKKQIGWYLAEQCALDAPMSDCLPSEALENLGKVIAYFDSLFTEESGKDNE